MVYPNHEGDEAELCMEINVERNKKMHGWVDVLKTM